MMWKQIDQKTFDAFLSTYGRLLDSDVNRICEPPMLSYHDFSEGKHGPESMVAKIILNTEDPNDYYVKVADEPCPQCSTPHVEVRHDDECGGHD